VINRRFHGLFPKDISAIVTLADVFARVGNEDEAFKWQESVVRENPNSKDTWYNLGTFFYNKAIRLQDSIKKYDLALTEDAKDAEAQDGYKRYSLGSAENFILALPRFDRVIEIDPEDELTVRLIGVSTFSVASMISDLIARLGAENAEETITAIWDKATTNLETERGDLVFWFLAKDALIKARERYPDDSSLCKMLKIVYARLVDVEGLKALKTECP
jgi:tetratricopeptide (TPR) repeat protein